MSDFIMDHEYTDLAIAAIVGGTILITVNGIASVPLIFGLSFIELINLVVFLSGILLFCASAVEKIEEYGYYLGSFFVVVSILIKFLSPESLANLLPFFIGLDIVLCIIRYFKPIIEGLMDLFNI